MTVIHPGADTAKCHQSCHQFGLKCRLGRPWHYRRNGRYYLRLRPRGSYRQSVTISLRTSERSAAMSLSQEILQALAMFHLDNPEATWEELRGHLLDIAEDALSQAHDSDSLSAYEMIFHDLGLSLAEASAKAPLSHDQHRALALGRRIMAAAQRRLKGDPEELMEIIRKINAEIDNDRNEQSPVSLSVDPSSRAPSGSSSSPSSGSVPSGPMTFGSLTDLYLAEHKDNVKESTRKTITVSCGVITELLGDLDMRTHTRAHLVELRAKLLESRKASTVNKLLTQLSTVLGWAVNNGYIERSFDKKLKILGEQAESSREAFSQDQVATLMSYAQDLSEGSWERWALSLGAITGARIGELYPLTKDDIRQIGDTWVIDINDNGDKGLKNKHSARVVPLIDGAYGFDLQAFLRFVHGQDHRLFTAKDHYFNKPLNELIRGVLRLESGGNLSFHSLRHSLAGLMKSQGVRLETAQAILGHSSQSITFDLYGGGQRVGVGILEEALKKAFAG